MIISNCTECSIFVNDININIPPKTRGHCVISENLFNKSGDIMKLIFENKIKINRGSNNIKSFVKDDKEFFILFGDTVWEGNGKSKSKNDLDFRR